MLKKENQKTLIIGIGVIAIIFLLLTNPFNQMAVIPYGQFDTCDAIANDYGSWGTDHGTIYINSESPQQGTASIQLTTNQYQAWLHKSAKDDDYWDVSSNPTITFYVRASKIVPVEFGYVTNTGPNLWESHATSINIQSVNTWQKVELNLYDIPSSDTGLATSDLSQIRRIYVFTRPDFDEVTLSIDNISFSDSIPSSPSTPKPSASTSPTTSSSPVPTQSPPPTSSSPVPTQSPPPTSTPPVVETPKIEFLDQTSLGLLLIIAFTVAAAILASSINRSRKR